MDAKIKSIVNQINEGLSQPLEDAYAVRMAQTILTLADKAYAPEYRGAVRVVLLPVASGVGSSSTH
jgi:hypothetical protein